jgi:hypothetical protein
MPMQIICKEKIYPREIDFSECLARVTLEGKETKLKKCSYWRLQLRATFVLLSCNNEKSEWFNFVYEIQPTTFALRKGCEGTIVTKDEEIMTITVTVKPGSKVLTILDRINPLDFGVKVKKLNCSIQSGLEFRSNKK